MLAPPQCQFCSRWYLCARRSPYVRSIPISRWFPQVFLSRPSKEDHHAFSRPCNEDRRVLSSFQGRSSRSLVLPRKIVTRSRPSKEDRRALSSFQGRSSRSLVLPRKIVARSRPSKEDRRALSRPSKEDRRALSRPSKEDHHVLSRPSKEDHHALSRPSKEDHHALFRPSKEDRRALFRPFKEDRRALASSIPDPQSRTAFNLTSLRLHQFKNRWRSVVQETCHFPAVFCSARVGRKLASEREGSRWVRRCPSHVNRGLFS